LWTKKEADQFNRKINEMFDTIDDEVWDQT